MVDSSPEQGHTARRSWRRHHWIGGGIFAVFFCCYAILAIVLMALGLEFLTSASGAATAPSNVGPGLGEIIGPAGTFGPVPDSAKVILSFAMLLGRLELFMVLFLFVTRFWRG